MTESRRNDYLNYGVRLYKAALRGDWRTASQIHDLYHTCFTEKITKRGDTALHIAAVAGHVDFVSQLVTLMVRSNSWHTLALTNNIGNTALCFAAASGTVAIAKVMVEANDNLPMIRNTKDIALGIIIDHPDLAVARDDQTKETPLHVLAKKSQKSSKKSQGFWSRFYNRCKEKKALQAKLELVKRLWERVLQEPQESQASLMIDPWRILFVAVEVGNVEFVTTLIGRYPDLIWKLDEKHRSIFHVAVQFRRETIFRLIFEIGAIKDLLATYIHKDTGDNILHLAAKLPSSDRLNCISGAALQMQREMLWFKVVEDIVQPQLAESKNEEGLTAKALFTQQHKELRKEGEEWLRKTAGSCSVVATLIAGVVFGAALKVPASQDAWLWIFVISDSVSLISSTASILMFLSIMTSRYAEKDFLQSLPQMLMIGLTLLFFSIATMMVAFTATFHIIFNFGYAWIFTSVFSCIPIFLFGLQEFPLLFEVFRSTIGSNHIFKPRHQLFSSP
ncbi:uncharacterized protein LOC141620857 [Silene latifolia]|uniref:uncharacterized protein LOC141620857 n=1 Tax=Silene latifolia TaxID=37657 RepID=UPI003D76C6F9